MIILIHFYAEKVTIVYEMCYKNKSSLLCETFNFCKHFEECEKPTKVCKAFRKKLH